MTISVTQEHIEQGISMNCEKCPISLALYDAGFAFASVTKDNILAGESFLESKRYQASLKVKMFIAKIDNHQRFLCEPFSFELIETHQ